jgi:hypothetical protein
MNSPGWTLPLPMRGIAVAAPTLPVQSTGVSRPVGNMVRIDRILKLAGTAGFFVVGLLFAASASAETLLGPDAVEVTATSGSECASKGDCVEGEADYVIHISVDGLAAYLLETRINSAGYENFRRFVDDGATTFDGRIDYTRSWTLPNHVSMVTGRPAEQPAGQPNTVHHGYLDNGTPDPGWTLHSSKFNPNVFYIASTWDVAHDNGLVTALYASKSKFVIFEQSYDSDSGAPDTIGPDNGTDKIDHYVNKESGSPLNGSEMHADFLADMAAHHFNYTFLHYRDPDSAGHRFGWGSSQWDASVQNVDGYLGDIFDLIENDPVLNGHTVVILTADHGGTGTGHGSETAPSVYRIPVFVWGAGVDAGVDLYALNPISRQDPSAPVPPGGAPVARPDYDAVPQPIRDGGTGNLALHHLGLGAIPGSSLNDDQDLHTQVTR